jgi:hypothetical protein
VAEKCEKASCRCPLGGEDGKQCARFLTRLKWAQKWFDFPTVVTGSRSPVHIAANRICMAAVDRPKRSEVDIVGPLRHEERRQPRVLGRRLLMASGLSSLAHSPDRPRIALTWAHIVLLCVSRGNSVVTVMLPPGNGGTI